MNLTLLTFDASFGWTLQNSTVWIYLKYDKIANESVIFKQNECLRPMERFLQ